MSNVRCYSRFPGSSENYHALFDCCDVDLLAEAAIWLSLHPEAGNEIYNISNGDTFRSGSLAHQQCSTFFVNVTYLLALQIEQTFLTG